MTLFYDLAAIGDINLDIILIVSRIPEADEEIRVLSLGEFPGGDAANVAVAFALLGGKSQLFGAVGKDLAGMKLLELLSKKGVNISRVIVVPHIPTGQVVSIVDANGQRRLLHWRGANAERSLTEEDLYLLRGAKCVYVADPLPSTMRALADWYSRGELAASLAMDPGAGGVSNGIDFLRPLLRFTTILFLNRLEAQKLTNQDDIVKAGKFLTKLCPLVVIKLGENGAIAFYEAEYVYAPSFKVPAIDSTGCGDAFNAAFLYQWLNNHDLQIALKWGNAAGAVVVQKIGAQMPSLEEVLSLVERSADGTVETF
jgi:ribokinase